MIRGTYTIDATRVAGAAYAAKARLYGAGRNLDELLHAEFEGPDFIGHRHRWEAVRSALKLPEIDDPQHVSALRLQLQGEVNNFREVLGGNTDPDAVGRAEKFVNAVALSFS